MSGLSIPRVDKQAHRKSCWNPPSSAVVGIDAERHRHGLRIWDCLAQAYIRLSQNSSAQSLRQDLSAPESRTWGATRAGSSGLWRFRKRSGKDAAQNCAGFRIYCADFSLVTSNVVRTSWRPNLAHPTVSTGTLGAQRARRMPIDQIIVLSGRHLRYALKQYVEYFMKRRPHQGLKQQLPDSTQEPPAIGRIP